MPNVGRGSRLVVKLALRRVIDYSAGGVLLQDVENESGFVSSATASAVVLHQQGSPDVAPLRMRVTLILT